MVENINAGLSRPGRSRILATPGDLVSRLSQKVVGGRETPIPCKPFRVNEVLNLTRRPARQSVSAPVEAAGFPEFAKRAGPV